MQNTSWEYWTDDALIDVEGWHLAGYDTSYLFPLLRQQVLQRNVEGYTMHALATVDELMRATPREITVGCVLPGAFEWAVYMENEMFRCCSGLARAAGLHPNLNVSHDSEDDITRLVQGEEKSG